MDDPVGDRGRFYYFWFGCIPVRLTIAILAIFYASWSAVTYYVLGALATLAAGGFLFNILFRSDKERGGFHGVVWWKEARYLHATLWGMTALFAFLQQPWAPWFLLADACFGILMGILHHAFALV